MLARHGLRFPGACRLSCLHSACATLRHTYHRKKYFIDSVLYMYNIHCSKYFCCLHYTINFILKSSCSKIYISHLRWKLCRSRDENSVYLIDIEEVIMSEPSHVLQDELCMCSRRTIADFILIIYSFTCKLKSAIYRVLCILVRKTLLVRATHGELCCSYLARGSTRCPLRG